MELKLINMKKSLINKENIIPITLFGFSIIFPLISNDNFWNYFDVYFILFFTSFIILHSFSFSKSGRIWGFFRVFGAIFSFIFFCVLTQRLSLVLDPKNQIFFKSGNPIDDERFVKYLFAFLFSLFVLGIGEIISYLRDIRFLLSLNKNNKDYFECHNCEGKGFIEKEDDDKLEQKNCKNCSGLGFLEKNSNNWFSRI
jgi:hypothetical protein